MNARMWTARLASVIMLGPLLAFGTGCGGSTEPSPPAPVAVMVDTDMGADDILAMLYLLGRQDVDVVAVSVVGDGIVRCPVGASNARAVLAAAGRTDIPVACGTDRPITGQAAFPDAWRTQADELYGMAPQWPVPTTGPTPVGDPVSLLVEQAAHRSGLRILALGPLTNIATALRRPEFRETGPQIIVSGGAVSEPGNMPTNTASQPVAEWNIGVDPVAADEVLRSGLATRWIPLDASNDVPADVWFVHALTSIARGPAGGAALALLETNPALSRGGYFYWDPLAAVALTTPEAVSEDPATLVVRTTGNEMGRTAMDALGTQVTIATKADSTAFINEMLHAFGPTGGPRPDYAPGTPDVLVTRQLGAFRLDQPHALPAGDTTIGFDAVSGGAYAIVIGRLAEGKTLADVNAAIAQGVTTAPGWFDVEATIEVPAGSCPTWVVNLPAGNHAVVASPNSGTMLVALGQITTD
jgi:pyrimidine-specific ribonucleoside hydrolase